MGCGASNQPMVYAGGRPGYQVLTNVAEVQTDPWEPVAAQAVANLHIQPQEAANVAATPTKQAKSQDPEDVWLQVCETLDVPKGEKNPNEDLVIKRSGWKTIRVFVSSTFRDMHSERELLVKEVFPDLRTWCESRRLHLVECDLRWGVPKDSTSELTLKTCLGEIDRCYQDNVMPFFLNMTSERIGWVPLPSDVPGNFADEYRWIFGLSMTEMEIVHGAYRKDNPNSLFLIRDDSFLNGQLPDKARSDFVDESKIAPSKLKILKNMIEDRFPPSRIIAYSAEYIGEDAATKRSKLKIGPEFQLAVYDFFKERIDKQYPLYDGEEDPFQRAKEAHESFMRSREESVLGRSDILKEITNYVCGIGIDTPLLILGQPGTGKSSILARVAQDTCTMAIDRKIPGGGNTGWYIFYHFVGAVPGSTDLKSMLCRLLKEIGAITDSSMPSDMDTTVQMTLSALNNTNTCPVIIVIDALNQFDEESASLRCNWVPRKLPPNVRCIFSMINDTPQHKNLMDRESKPKEIFVQPLTLAIRKDIVKEFLGRFNKKLDLDQMFSLLSKDASANPLWLTIACEELRVFGQYRGVSDKINSMPDGLLDLLETVLTRFENEGGGHLLIATLCLIEVSTFGLLESELLGILSDEDNLMMPDKYSEKGEKEKSEKEKKKGKHKGYGQLPAFKWATVYRSLRPFLRPFGDSGEGRLDFYHRTLSKVVRKKYLKVKVTDVEEAAASDDISPYYKWWHKKLADYFEWSENFDRKVEEYPYHLSQLKDIKRLEDMLMDWRAIDRLYDYEFSDKLLKYWGKCGGLEQMIICYAEKLQDLKSSGASDDELSRRYEQIGRIFIQAGNYDQAQNVVDVALSLEMEKLGQRAERMADLEGALALIWDQKVKLHEFCTREQIPEEKECMKHQAESIKLYESLESNKVYKLKLAKMLVKTAFTHASFADCGGDADMPVSQAISIGQAKIDRAATMFKEMNDSGNLAEAYMTKAVLMRNNKSEQLKWYHKAEEMCREVYGDYHPLMGRINMNTGICHEDARDYKKAYEYFKRNMTINTEVYGPDHIKAQRSKGILQEPTYRGIAQRLGDTEVLNINN